jgi:hypothetical protein
MTNVGEGWSQEAIFVARSISGERNLPPLCFLDGGLPFLVGILTSAFLG